MPKIRAVCPLLFLFCLILRYPTDSGGQDRPANEPRLEKILKETADYCEKLKAMALDFVCHEQIQEKTNEFEKRLIFSPSKASGGLGFYEDLKISKTKKGSYVYDYQMIKKGGDFKEKRDLLEENGKKRNNKDVQPKTMRLSANYLVFGPVGFLSKTWQPHFQYEILGTEKLGPSTAVVIRASPKEITDENYSFGRIWVDDGDSSILKIEWEPASIPNLAEKVESSIGELKRKLTWAVSYSVVKNGIRFPGSQLIREVFITKMEKEHIKYEAGYIYDHYRFFTVETEVQIR